MSKIRQPRLYFYNGDHLVETRDIEKMSSEEIVKELEAKGIYQTEQGEASGSSTLYERLKNSLTEKRAFGKGGRNKGTRRGGTT